MRSWVRAILSARASFGTFRASSSTFEGRILRAASCPPGHVVMMVPRDVAMLHEPQLQLQGLPGLLLVPGVNLGVEKALGSHHSVWVFLWGSSAGESVLLHRYMILLATDSGSNSAKGARTQYCSLIAQVRAHVQLLGNQALGGIFAARPPGPLLTRV